MISYVYRWFTVIVVGALVAGLTCPGVSRGQEYAPPEKGGVTHSLRMPPIYKGYGGFELQWYRPGATGDLGGLVDLGLYRDLGSPVVGILGIGVEGYGGFRAAEADGGGRAYLSIPVYQISAGVDYNIPSDAFDFILGLNLPMRRGGLFGRASVLALRWIPDRDHTFSLGVSVPLWGSNLGDTRPRRDYVRLPERKPSRIELGVPDPDLLRAMDLVGERAQWIARLSQPFAEHSGGDARRAMEPFLTGIKAHIGSTDARFPRGHTLNEEIRVYHEELDRAFSIALSEEAVPAGSSTPAGRTVSTVAREILLEEVLLPYNYLLGQRKKNDKLVGFVAVAQAEFAGWLLSEGAIELEKAREAFLVFQTLCDVMEDNRRELRDRWEDSRFVWMPLQYALKPEQHDSQAELDAIVELATRAEFTQGNRSWLIINEQFQREIARSVRRAEDYHVLWIHDIRGVNAKGKPDGLAYEQVANYLTALTERVRAYDEAGKLPIYMIFLDQYYFEANKSRLWLRLLEKPLDYEIGLPSAYSDWEQRLHALQDELRQAVEESYVLRVERSQYGDEWLKDRIKVHVNITNPADASFYSFHVVGILSVPDNNMRDHRKIAFYDITEEDPYRGMAMFTGMGIGEHYTGANWEDRAIMIQGPGALAVKDAARYLLKSQGFTDEEMPVPLRAQAPGRGYEEQIEAELGKLPDWMTNPSGLMQLHSETGFMPKPINPAKAVLYSLMPEGSLLKVPDSLWQSYLYASLLGGSALRGCRVLVIAPTQESAPSAGAPQLARAHGLLSRLIVFDEEMTAELQDSGGLLKVGLYSPQQGVGDLAGRFSQAVQAAPPWGSQIYALHPEFRKVARSVPSILDSLGYSVSYLAAEDSVTSPKLHLKANFFASAVAWDKLMGRPEWADFLREYIGYLAQQSGLKREGEAGADVRAIPERLSVAARELLRNFLDDLSPREREELVYYFTVGSVNMDYRSMCLDGEVMIVLSSWGALSGVIDFMLLAGLCEWVESTDELDALLAPPGDVQRTMAGFIKLML